MAAPETREPLSRYRWWIIGGLLLIGIAAAGLLSQSTNATQVTFFDVGQGDGAHIRLAGGIDIVIDGGPSEAFVRQLRSNLPFTDRTIELLILTHPDADHLTGLVPVVEQLQVERVLAPAATRTTKTFQNWQQALQASGAPVTNAQAGQTYIFPNANLTVLWPPAGARQPKPDETNDLSIVARLDIGPTCLLLTGDISTVIEEQLPKDKLDCDVLKVAHHGSRFSTAKTFLRAVSPDLAVISVGGNNRFGHPAPSVMKELEEARASILRTDQVGTIRLRWDKAQQMYTVRTTR